MKTLNVMTMYHGHLWVSPDSVRRAERQQAESKMKWIAWDRVNRWYAVVTLVAAIVIMLTFAS